MLQKRVVPRALDGIQKDPFPMNEYQFRDGCAGHRTMRAHFRSVLRSLCPQLAQRPQGSQQIGVEVNLQSLFRCLRRRNELCRS